MNDRETCLKFGSPAWIRTKVYSTTLSPMNYEPWFESQPGSQNSLKENESCVMTYQMASDEDVKALGNIATLKPTSSNQVLWGELS